LMTYDQYRQFADACIRWAKNAKSEEKRRSFLEIAAAWADLATKAENHAQGLHRNWPQ
jgi:hypothetical protein